MLNKLLAQQVHQHLGDPSKLPGAFKVFLQSISGSYDRYEEKTNGLEIAVDDGTQKLGAMNEKLLNETEGLKNAHQELCRIFKEVNEGFFSRDILTESYIHLSAGFENIYGYAIEDFIADSHLWSKVIHPDDEILLEGNSMNLNKGIPIKNCYRIIHKDQSTRWIEVKAIPALVN